MRRSLCCVLPGLFLVGLAGGAEGQIDREKLQNMAPIKPRITSVTYFFHGVGAEISLAFTGIAFPANQSQNKQRLFRLRAPAWKGGGEDVYYVGQPSQTLGGWTATRAEVMLPNLPVGRTFTIGLGEKEMSSPDSTFVLLSNEVQYLVPMEMAATTPHPIPMSTSEIVGRTACKLGPRGGRVVKLDGQTLNVTRWSPDEWNFAFLKPNGLAVPAIHHLWVESAGGQVLSTKLTVRFEGPPIH